MGHGDLRGMTRARVRQNYCPKCGAAPGEPCRGTGKDARPRVANHAERRAAAKVTRQKRTASYGQGGHDIWNRVVYQLGTGLADRVAAMRADPAIVALESEIERAFAVLVILAQGTNSMTFGLRETYPDGFVLIPQYSIGPYRVDFVFGHSRRLALRDCLAVELDGHEWHEKTKEQVARDKARDRYLSAVFGRVIHFTGSEIYQDVAQCYLEAVKVYHAIRGPGGSA